MSNISPTIVTAKLDDQQLKDSVDEMVRLFNESLAGMVAKTQSTVQSIQNELNKIGKTKFDANESSDSGSSKRTKAHEKLTKAVNDASEAVSKETQKLQDLQQSLSGASDREQNFISQKERAANTIAQENELLQRQEQELGQLRSQQQAFVSSEQSQTSAINAHKTAFDNLDAKTKEYLSTQERLLQKGSGITPNERKLIGIDQQTLALIERAKKELDSFNLTLSDGTKYSKDPFSSKFQSLEILKKELDNNIRSLEQWKKETHLTPDDITKIDAVLQKYKEYSRIIDELRNKETKLLKNHDVFKFTDDFGKYFTQRIPLVRADESYQDAYWKLQKTLSQTIQTEQQKAQIDSQVAAKEKEIAETRGRIAAATKEQTEAEKNANQAAKEKANIQSQVASQEKKVADAKTQLTTATQKQAEVEKQSVQNIAQQTAARDKQAKKNQELSVSFDQLAQAEEMAKRGGDLTKVFDEKGLAKLKNELREAQAEYKRLGGDSSASTKAAELAVKIDELTTKVKQYELALKSMTTTQKANVGFDIKGWIKDIDAQDARLKQLNKWYAELEKQAVTRGVSESRITDEIRRQADAIRQTRKWKEQGWANINGNIYYDPERSTASTKEAKIRGSLEEQILRTVEKRQQNEELLLAAQRQEEANARAAAEQEARRAAAEQERLGTIRQITVEQEKQKKKYTSPITTTYTAPTTDMLRKFIASKAGVDVKDVKIFDETAASASKLQSALKKVQTAYSNMSAEERNSPFGQALIRRFQELQREAQKTQRQLSRPVSLKDALGGSEKTLDDIAYKMQRLRAYKQGIDLTKPNAANEIRQVDEALVKLQKDADKWMSKSQEMIKGNTALGRSWNYMKNRLAFYFTVGASTSFVKSLIEIRGQYELLDRSIGILIDSAQNGSQIFAELNAMAIKSPFTTMELGAAAKQLVAYDVAAKDVVDTTRRLADMAAAVGIPIERLTYALGQIKAYGYLNARDARMFANAGIPLVKELADYYTELEGRLVSTADVYDRIKKKAIDYNDVMSVVNKMTDEGGKFFDFQEKAADTLKVRIANLTLAWNNMLNEMGKDNQGMLTEGLKVTKQIFESWRDINNMVVALGLTYGTIKAAQIAYYLWVMRTEKAVGAWSKIINAIDYAFNAKIANVINSLKTSLVGFFTNPAAMLTVAFTALSVALTKAYLDYRDLQAANEEFNKSVAKNAEENIKSIDKFFGDYKKQLESVGSLNSADQTKLWERVQEEIEKTTKNAEKYIEILNKIPEVSKRIEVGESVLEQSKRIQDELKYMAERGMFNVGGGFANDSAAKDLQQYSDAVNELITKYGDLDNAKKEALKVNEITLESGETIRQYTGEYADFQRSQIEAEKELQNIVSTLDKVNMAEILGTGDMETQLANVRSFAIAWRDAFLATEKGSKISAEGQALLNSYIDKWIEQQARVNYLIKDENTAAIEANRTAWETFFKFLNTEERKRLDVAIKTNQLESKAVQELWDEASKRMQKNATTSYNLIQQQIADLRNTPDIVINVVYRNNKEELEEDQKKFDERYIQPKDSGVLSTDEYLKREKANREKYGTLMRKRGEDTAEYEKRISDERKKNLELSEKNGKIIEENKNKTSEYSIAVTELAKKEKKAADDRLKVIKEIEKDSGYDFSTKKENAAARKEQSKAEKEVSDAFKNELSVLKDMQSGYDKLRKSGVDNITAIDLASKGYEDTLNRVNATLAKYGISKFNAKDFLGKDVNAVLRRLQQQRDEAMASGKLRTGTLRELDVEIKKLNVEAKTYNMDKITKGLNNELGKLKDEYELSVELDANPELGDIFADMFGINTSTLPKTFGDALDRAQIIINRKLAEMNITTPFDLMEGNIDSFAKSTGLDKDGAVIKELVSAQNAYRDMFKKNITETEKMLDDYIKKYGDYSDKIAEIEAGRLEKLKKLNEAYYTEEMRKRPEYTAKLNAIEQGASKEKQQVDFDDFKNSRYYTMMFENLDYISTKTIRDMRDRVRELMDTMSDLTPEQLKTLISQYEKLEQKLVKRSPFKTLTKDLKEYFSTSKERKAANVEFKNAQKEYDAQKKNVAALKEKYEQAKANSNTSKSYLDFLRIEIDGENEILQILKQQLDAAQKKADKYNLTEKLAKSEALQVAQVVGQNLQSLGELRDFLQQDLGVELSDELNGLVDGLSKVGQGINKITSSATSGDVVGVITGVGQTVYGLYDGIASIFGGGSAADRKITRQIEDSERAVKRLQYTLLSLEDTAEHAYGAMVSGAQRAVIANKELQLAEIKRQIQLEQSRDSKDRDEDKIESLQSQYKDLLIEIRNGTQDIVNEMLGISSVGDAITSVVEAMITAFKNGEDAMQAFSDKWDEMIDNMILKLIVSQYMQKAWDNVMKTLNEREEEFLRKSSSEKADAQRELDWWENKNPAEQLVAAARELGMNMFNMNVDEALKYADEKMEALRERVKAAESASEQASENYLKWSLDYMMGEGRNYMTEVAQGLIDGLGDWYTFGQDSNKNLSALQQGIQGVTEDTAGAIEAYMNGMSQQVYLQSDLLTQIRDAVVGLNADVQLATQAQILLQLQQSYAVQMAIQGILAGVLNPSGRAFVVELNS